MWLGTGEKFNDALTSIAKTFIFLIYRVFFIEGQIRISCKMLKISLFHVVSGLRTEVTMGDLISDQIKSPFYVIDAHINLQKLQLKFTENELKSCIWS